MDPLVSKAEDTLADALRRRGIRVTRQVSVPSSARPFLLDFAVADARVDIEVDGPHHYTSLQRSKDAYRDRLLRRRGWRVIRVPAQAVYDDADGVAAKLARTLERGGHAGALAWPLMMLRRAWGSRVVLLLWTAGLDALAWKLFARGEPGSMVILLCAISAVSALRVTRLDYLPMGGGFVRRRRKPFSVLSDIAMVLLFAAVLIGALAWMSSLT